MATTPTIDRDRTRNNGAPGSEFSIEAPKTRSRLPEIALGVLIIAAFGLAALWFFTQATEKEEVLALSGPLDRGEVLEPEDLVVVRINTDDELATVIRLESESVVGRVALANLPAGTLITPSLFAADDALEVGEGVVGLELDAGQIPATRLLPGNTVSVVLTPRQGSTDDLSAGGALELGEILVDAAVVVESTPVGAQGRQFIALSMTEEEAQAVSVAASLQRVRLIQVARED